MFYNKLLKFLYSFLQTFLLVTFDNLNLGVSVYSN